MTADLTHMHIDDHSPTTSFAGRNPAAPKPIDAANLAPLHAGNPSSNAYPPVPNAAAALVPRETAPSTAQPAAQNPHRSAPLPASAPSGPRFPPLEAFGRRPQRRSLHQRVRKGRHPKPYTIYRSFADRMVNL